MVIKAAGQVPFAGLVAGSGLAQDKGRIVVGPGGGVGATDGSTDRSGVFAGGDCVNGGKEVVDAVQAGKDAAAAILNYLGVTKK
jgi:glutamate synthase (NADPH/NADH) small chain